MSQITIVPPSDLVEIDIATVHGLAARLATALMEGAGDVVLDLSNVTFLDTAGAAVLVAAQGHLAGKGCRLRVRDAGPSVSRLLTLAGLGTLLSVDAGQGRPG